VDWEFAYSSSPLFDVGNMLRHHGEQPVGYRGGFVEGLADGGTDLPEDWPEIARALDLFALADLLTRPDTTAVRHSAGHRTRPLAA